MKKSFAQNARDAARAVVTSPRTAYRSAVDNPQRTKRMLKVSLSLTTAIAFTLPKMFASWYGQNPFLLGTIAIYLFPVKTVGGQIVGTVIGLSGILLGLAYANLVLFLARLIQDDSDDFDHIHAGRRAFLWCALAAGAFGCGYVRSKFVRSYLAINFFMLVNMFALIRGINHFNFQFHSFFYVMLFGACTSLVVNVLVWPEDRGGVLKRDVIKGICEIKGAMSGLRQTMRFGVMEEVDTSGVRAAEAALSASLHEANYEISFTRVESSFLVPLNRCVSQLISVSRVFNASMRRKHRLQKQLAKIATDRNSLSAQLLIDANFVLALGLLDAMVERIEDLYNGNQPTSLDHEKFAQSIDELCDLMNAEVLTRVVSSYQDLEDSSFTDQINTSILDIMDVVKDMARAITIIEPSRRRLVLPRKLRRREFEKAEPGGENQQSDGISRYDVMSRVHSMMPSDEAYLLFMESTTVYDRACIWTSERLVALQKSRHVKYAIKLMVVLSALALPAFISNWYLWYDFMRAQLAMVSALVAMETTRGMTFRTAGMKIGGALLGGSMAFIVLHISGRFIGVEIGLTSLVGLGIGYLVQHPTWAKSGTVCALAYNLVLGVATVYPEQGPAANVFARRLLTLPVGLFVATFVHLTLFPYHSRLELVKGLGSSLDWIHHLLFAIEASDAHPSLHGKFDAMAQKASNRVGFAKSLLPATHYEVSLGGQWPYKRFERIVDKIMDVMSIIVGETSADPVLAVHFSSVRTSERIRRKLLASICNDLLVISHSLSARLFMPRHESVSTSVLMEYSFSLLAAELSTTDGPAHNYCDLGRIADLVSEMSYLREEVDELTTETQCPRNGLIPQLSMVVSGRVGKSHGGSPSTPRGRSRAGSPAGRSHTVSPAGRSHTVSPARSGTTSPRGRSGPPSMIEFVLGGGNFGVSGTNLTTIMSNDREYNGGEEILGDERV